MGRKQPKKAEGYRVKDILDFKEQEGREYLLIWWYGYPKREATWQPVENIQHVFDFNTYYQKLKQDYQHRAQQSSNKEEEPEPSHSDHIDQVQMPIKNKPIAKISRRPKAPSDVYHSDSELEQPSQVVAEEQVQAVDEKPAPKIVQKSIQDQQKIIENDRGVDLVNEVGMAELKKMLKQARPVRFQIRIKEFKELPLVGQQLKAIKETFVRDGKRMYQIQLEGKAFTEPIVLHQNYIKVLWPRKFAEYLLSKVK